MRVLLSCVFLYVFGAAAPVSAGPTKMVKQGMVRVEMKPDNTYTATPVRPTELAASYNPPPKPSATHVCKRADLDTQVIAAKGGKVFTKGACSASGAKPGEWPLKAVFQMTTNVRQQAGRSCRIKWARRKRDKHPKANNPFTFANKLSGKIHIRYCFLDMKPKKKGRKKTWHVDCGKDGVHRNYTVNVSYLVSCIPPR